MDVQVIGNNCMYCRVFDSFAIQYLSLLLFHTLNNVINKYQHSSFTVNQSCTIQIM